MLDSINALHWRIQINRERFPQNDWYMEAFVWMDNGYGGSETSVTSRAKTFEEAQQELLLKIKEHDSAFRGRYH
jgi:hypothetical protein